MSMRDCKISWIVYSSPGFFNLDSASLFVSARLFFLDQLLVYIIRLGQSDVSKADLLAYFLTNK